MGREVRRVPLDWAHPPDRGWKRSKVRSIRPPRMYAEGFPHANCAGFCSRMGNDQAVHLLRTRPDVYHGHELREEEFRTAKGRDVSILVDRRGVGDGPRKSLPLRQLREEVEAFDAANPRLPGLEPQPMFGDGFNCGCNQADP